MLIKKDFTYAEFIKVAKENAGRARNRGANSGTGNLSFKKAVKTAKRGWDSGIKKLDLDLGVLTQNGVSFMPNVAGAFVNVPNYLNNQPDTMWEIIEGDRIEKEFLTIYCRTSYRGGISGKFALEYCSGVIELVNKLNTFYNIRIIAVFDGDFNNSVRMAEHVTIKDYDDRFVLNNIAFAFHPAFFRCLRWGYLDGTKHGKDYGSTVSQSKLLNRLEKDEINKERVIVTPSVDEHSDYHENGWFEIAHCNSYNINEEELKQIKELYTNKNE